MYHWKTLHNSKIWVGIFTKCDQELGLNTNFSRLWKMIFLLNVQLVFLFVFFPQVLLEVFLQQRQPRFHFWSQKKRFEIKPRLGPGLRRPTSHFANQRGQILAEVLSGTLGKKMFQTVPCLANSEMVLVRIHGLWMYIYIYYILLGCSPGNTGKVRYIEGSWILYKTCCSKEVMSYPGGHCKHGRQGHRVYHINSQCCRIIMIIDHPGNIPQNILKISEMLKNATSKNWWFQRPSELQNERSFQNSQSPRQRLHSYRDYRDHLLRVKPPKKSAMYAVNLEQSGHQTTGTVQPAIQTLFFSCEPPFVSRSVPLYIYIYKDYIGPVPVPHPPSRQRVTTSPGAWIVSSRRPDVLP